MSEHKQARLSPVLGDDCLSEILSFLEFRELIRYRLVQQAWKTIIRSLIPCTAYLDLSNICDTSNKSIRNNLFPLLDIDGDGLFKHFQTRRVNLSGVAINDDTCRMLLQNNTHLRELNLHSCSKVKTLDYILPQLTYLNISYTYIRDPEEQMLLPNLKTLVGRNAGVLDIGTMAPNLETLYIRHLSHSVAEDFASIVQGKVFQHLKHLSVDMTCINYALTLFYDIINDLPCLEKLSVFYGDSKISQLNHALVEYHNYHRLGQYTNKQLQKMFGRHFSLNDFDYLPREMVHVTLQQIQEYEINLNLFAQEHGEQWMKNANTVETILDAGVNLAIRYRYHTFDYRVQENIEVLPIVLRCPRACSRFDFKPYIHFAISKSVKNKEEIIRMLHERYDYDLNDISTMLSSLKRHNNDLETFKLLEELFPQVVSIMPTLDGLSVLQNASDQTVKYILERGYANSYVKHVPNFVWLPETYTEERRYSQCVQYLFPQKYRNGKAIDPDARQMDRSITTEKPKNFQDAMINLNTISKGTKNTRLHHVTRGYHASPLLIAILIKCGVPVNAVNKNKETALRLAIDHQDIPAVRCLLFYNANLDIPLHEDLICRNRDLRILSNAIQIRMKLEHNGTTRDLLFKYDDHDDSDKLFRLLVAAGATLVEIEENDHIETEARAKKLLAMLKHV